MAVLQFFNVWHLMQTIPLLFTRNGHMHFGKFPCISHNGKNTNLSRREKCYKCQKRFVIFKKTQDNLARRDEWNEYVLSDCKR